MFDMIWKSIYQHIESWKTVESGSIVPKDSIDTSSQLIDWLGSIFYLLRPLQLSIKTMESTQIQIWTAAISKPQSLEFRSIEGLFQSENTSLYMCERQDDKGIIPVIIKRIKDANHSAIAEAFLQTCAHATLEAYGLPYAVPQVRDILRHPSWGTLFTMDPIYDAILASTFLSDTLDFSKVSQDNDIIIVDILTQLAVYLFILERTMGINHRDLKSNNILLIKKGSSKKKITVPFERLSIECTIQNQIVLIDFGFACMSQPSLKKLIISTQNDTHQAFGKVGQDMFTYLTTLYKIPELRNCITPSLRALFRKWLRTTTKDWAAYLERGIEQDTMLMTNLFIESNLFQAKAADPLEVLQDLSHFLPTAVAVSTMV